MSLFHVLWLWIYTVGAFTIFWVFGFQLIKSLNIHPADHPVRYKNLLFAQRLLGFTLFGPLAALFAHQLLPVTWDQWGLLLQQPSATLSWIVGLLLIIIPANFFIARSAQNQAAYPQVRYRSWSPGFFLVNALTWVLYLLGYEFLFRGLLLFPLIEVLGLWSSIGLNVTLYAIVHAPKGWREVIGAVPFGIVLCMATYETGSFWAAFTAHGVQAVVNEFFSIQANPRMGFHTGQWRFTFFRPRS